MATTLDPARTAATLATLAEANAAFDARYPGEPHDRQPVHTVYGGAHLFRSDTAPRLGQLALAHLERHAPRAEVLADALELPGDVELHHTIYERTVAKLQSEPVEDFRIDFEDGYGNRPWDEEDACAVSAAQALAKGHAEGTLPPFHGIRIKPFTAELAERSLRTLDRFVTALLDAAGGVPPGFRITLPKVTIPDQVTAMVDLLGQLEHARGLDEGALDLELMIETTQAIIGPDGRCPIPAMVDAAGGRCVGAHFGTYDFTASAQITAQHQAMDHPACDFAKQVMKMALAGTGVMLSDGATNVMPVGPHRGAELSTTRQAENDAVVHAAWKLGYDHIVNSLRGGWYQGWDLHPGQLPIRYAANIAFFLEGHAQAHARLRNFVEQAARATLVGDVFDDAATGQGLLNTFLRAHNCGAITMEEIESTGLTRDEILGRSFVKILENRRKL